MRPIAFRSPVPAIPTTSVANSSGAMIILIIRRNASARGLTATPTPGQTAPTRMPASSPIKICVVRCGRRNRDDMLSPRGLDRRAGLAIGFSALDGFALVVFFFPFGEADRHFDAALLEVHAHGNQRHAFFDRLADQLPDLVA